MSYIFSSNGNEYTFKKMDNMLINLPDKDGKHILIRSSKDGDTKYSWETVNLIVNVNDIKASTNVTFSNIVFNNNKTELIFYPSAKTNKELIKKISYSGAAMIIFNKLKNILQTQ